MSSTLSLKNTPKVNKTHMTAIISDDDCMISPSWIDFSTQEKNVEFVNAIRQAKESGCDALISFINNNLSGWIIDMCDEYDNDLAQLSRNWSSICNRFQVPSQKIVLVDYISFNESAEKGKHKNLNLVCDLLTASGFVVKDKNNFMMCKGCHKLMLSESTQKNLWATNNVWKVCRQCTTQN